ncbi:MAG: hypothetical protein WDW38_011469 [Sanguina aurantia]
MGRRSAKIAGRKGKSDALKAKTYGRVGKLIVQYVKSGGSDPVVNAKLKDLLQRAKELGVPKDIIDRNLKKASDKTQGDYQELTYEAYGPGGTGFIVQCLTDNVNRSAGDVKAIITKSGCKNAEPGSVLFNFSRVGKVLVEGSSEDAVFEAAMEAGAEDVAGVPAEEDGEESTDVRVYMSVEEFFSAQAKLKELGFSVNAEQSELIYKAGVAVEVDDEAFAKCEAIIEKLLELDDVDAVFTNADGLEA